MMSKKFLCFVAVFGTFFFGQFFLATKIIPVYDSVYDCLGFGSSNEQKIEFNGLVADHVSFDWKKLIESGPITSIFGTTGVGVPGKIRSWLLSTGVAIDDDAQDYFGSEAAVKEMEEKICGGWSVTENNFGNKKCVNPLSFGDYSAEKEIPMLDPSEIDIVTPSIRNLDFLNQWREFFQGFHIIIIQDGDQSVFLEVPDWVDYELHKRVDIEKALGENQWIISQRDASIRNYGFLLSKKRYIYTIDDDCRPSFDSRGYKVNPLAFHVRNLKTPSTPYMFNTLYDPYQIGSDFVRGYPYSLRAGVPTGVSHGLWMNQPDYDAPTQLLKVTERVQKMHEMALTVPAGIFFPLCSMNVAFDRELIGPAMMQGLMGDGQPWARYDDMFSGWAAKSVADHLGVGIKSGMPYIRHNKASNPFVNLKKEFLGLWWQEIVLRFFMKDVKYSSEADTPSKAYKELAGQIRINLSGIHDYFDRLATSMEIWADSWDMATDGSITFSPSRHEQPNLKPINLDYYSKDIYGVEDGGNPNLVSDEKVVAIDSRPPPMVDHAPSMVDLGPSRKLKIYVYDLPFEHTLEHYLKVIDTLKGEKSNCDWNLNVCKEEKWLGSYSSMRQYGGDAILIQKFRRYPNRVYDPEDADLFVVPYPHSSWCRKYTRPCWTECRCVTNVDDVLGSLNYFNDSTKKFHLFLLSGDTSGHNPKLKEMPLYVSLGDNLLNPGSKNIVMPPPITEPAYQPSALARFDWTKPRNTAVFMQVGLVNVQRDRAYELLNNTSTIGGLPVEVYEVIAHRRLTLSPQETWQKYRETYFCPVVRGDRPYQKRFFDVAVSGCIPVVVGHPSKGDNPNKSWWLPNEPGWDVTYPFASSINYKEFVVELDDMNDIVPTLEALLADKPKIRKMQSALARVAEKFVYGLGDEFMKSGDAFDMILGELESYVAEQKEI